MSNKKVKMIVQISGARDGKDWPAPGEEITLPSDEAEMLIRNGQAMVPGSEKNNALADVLGVETAALADAGTAKGQKAIRTQVKPAPHADEEQAYHVPVLPGEEAAAKAGQAAVDAANKDLVGEESVDKAKEGKK
jgi:hypothetical protein